MNSYAGARQIYQFGEKIAAMGGCRYGSQQQEKI